MSIDNFLYDSPSPEIFNFEQSTLNPPRQSVLLESRKEKYRSYYGSKWANLKFFLQDKISLESSVELLKTKTVKQFSSKCQDIYRKKIEIQLLTEKNRKIIYQGMKSLSYSNSGTHIKVSVGTNGLPTDGIPEFLFTFRENNHLMLKLIDNIDNKIIDILVPFLCHFFYENFYTESMEQEEIIYLVYLLLEKEIDKLIIPCEQSFLDDSFLSRFLKEMGSRYEIKNYIDIIMNDLICFLEESNSYFYSLDLYDDVFLNDLGVEKNTSAQLKGSAKIESNQAFKAEEKNKDKNPSFRRSQPTFGKNNNNHQLIDNLPNEAKFNSSQQYLTEQYSKEKNEVVKQFLFKHLKIIRTEEKPLLFDCSQTYDFLKKKKEKVSDNFASQFKQGYELITKFISDLLTELENDTIVPYTIKCICNFIYVLMKQKFNCSRFELNNFVCRFLFDKLIFPVLINPERNDIGKDRLISLPTRKNLFNIYLILKNLVKGELFNSEKQVNLVIFNKFILDNYHRVSKIIEKIIDVKIPKKLHKLSKQFYSTEDFILDNSKRSEEEINYEYFKENPSDFMQHKSICFTINELNLIYNTVEAKQDVFLTPGSKLEKLFEKLSTFISMIKGKPNHYYVVISDNYNKEAKELLFNKEKKKPLGKGKSYEEIMENIHYCISYLISNLDILPHWDWVNERNYKTKETFQFIDQYLNSYEEVYNMYTGTVPLNWYSLYIINNLDSIKPEDAKNDYQPLYEKIEDRVTYQHKKLSKLNEFLTVNMTAKFLLIDNKIKIFEEELKKVRNTFINIKTLQLMDWKELTVYLISVKDLIKSGAPSEAIEGYTGNNNLILQKDNVMIDKFTNKKKFEIPKEYACNNINHFIFHLLKYSRNIFEDIKSLSPLSTTKKQILADNFFKNPETKAKNILDAYLNYIYDYCKENNIFKETIITYEVENNESNVQNDNINPSSEEKNINSEDIAKNSIKNYILKTLSISIRMLDPEPKLQEDIDFGKKCEELRNITLEDLKIPEEIYDSFIFEKIISHVKRMDDVRAPEEMLKELELAVQLINSLFIFMMNKKETGNDNFTPVIMYVIIKASPERIYFNTKLISYFFDEKEKLGKNYYCVTLAITSLDYIMKELKINPKIKAEDNQKNSEKDNEPAPTAK